jgi:aubergine-like protein
VTKDLVRDATTRKTMDNITKCSPQQRYESLMKLIYQINNNPTARSILDKWNIHLNEQLLECNSKILPTTSIFFKNAKGDSEDFSNLLKTGQHLSTKVLKNWLICYQSRDSDNVDEFIHMLLKLSRPMGFKISEPTKYQLSSTPKNEIEVYLKGIQTVLKDIRPQFVVCVIPSKSKNTYDAIKKVCSLDFGLPSQVIVSKTISDYQKLASVVTKIAVQMNSKLGGEIWGTNIPVRILCVQIILFLLNYL